MDIMMSISTVLILISPGDYFPVVFREVWIYPELLLDAKHTAWAIFLLGVIIRIYQRQNVLSSSKRSY